MQKKTTKTSSKQTCVGKGTSTGSRTQATTTDTTTAGNNNDRATATVGEVQCFVDDDYDSSIQLCQSLSKTKLTTVIFRQREG